MKKGKGANKTFIILLVVVVLVVGVVLLILSNGVVKDDNNGGYFNNSDSGLKKNYCSQNGVKAGQGFCPTVYIPVCGWFGKNIQCLKYPCAQTYSNQCFACVDDKVEYWTEGECPK